MIGELERATRLLANWVEDSRQVPEPPERLKLSRVINDLVKLLRYQLDPGIVIDLDVPEELYCRLPEGDFRHVLLNLVINAAQAIGKGPGTTIAKVRAWGRSDRRREGARHRAYRDVLAACRRGRKRELSGRLLVLVRGVGAHGARGGREPGGRQWSGQALALREPREERTRLGP